MADPKYFVLFGTDENARDSRNLNLDIRVRAGHGRNVAEEEEGEKARNSFTFILPDDSIEASNNKTEKRLSTPSESVANVRLPATDSNFKESNMSLSKSPNMIERDGIANQMYHIVHIANDEITFNQLLWSNMLQSALKMHSADVPGPSYLAQN